MECISIFEFVVERSRYARPSAVTGITTPVMAARLFVQQPGMRAEVARDDAHAGTMRAKGPRRGTDPLDAPPITRMMLRNYRLRAFVLRHECGRGLRPP